MINNMKNQKGITLIELMVALVVGIIIMGAVYSVMNTGQKSSASIARKVLTQQDARAVLNLMTLEIRMASFNPQLKADLWTGNPSSSSGSCADYTFVAERKGLQIAGENQILVAMDLNADEKIGHPGENEYIRYTYENNQIRRRVGCGNNMTILGGAGSGTRVINDDAGTSLFQYFDAIGTAPMTLPLTNSQIDSIRRIRITIVTEIENQTKPFHVSQKTYTTDILVRNHALDEFYD